LISSTIPVAAPAARAERLRHGLVEIVERKPSLAPQPHIDRTRLQQQERGRDRFVARTDIEDRTGA